MIRLSASMSGPADGVRPLDGHVRDVEKDDEDAVVRIGDGLEHFALVVGIPPLALREAVLDADELEGFDLLRLAVFEDFEVRGGQPFDDLSVAAGVGVHQHEVRAAAEDLPRRRLLGVRSAAVA